MKQRAASPLATVDLQIGYPLKKAGVQRIASDLNLSLQAGEFTCLLGPNGAGKSTLIRSLAGMQPALAGSIQLEGQELHHLDARSRARRISVVLTDSLPIGMFTGRALVALGRHPHTSWTGTLTRHDRERVEWALDAVDAQPLANRLVNELSDGERQKIMIARALAQEARVMFLDEPTAYLDLPRRIELMRALRDLAHRENIAILLSTHDLELALRCADKLWLLGTDATLRQGSPEVLACNGDIARVFASNKLDWDHEHGTFHMHRDPCALAQLSGSGPHALWTRRALARLGYGLTADQQRASLSIALSQPSEGPHWEANHKGEKQSFNDLESVIHWIKSLHPSRH